MKACIGYRLGLSQAEGYFFLRPHNGDYSILGSMLGSPILGNYQVSKQRVAVSA